MKKLLLVTQTLLVFILLAAQVSAQVNFTGPEILGKPTNNSITINIVADVSITAFVAYGLTPSSLPNQTPNVSAAANEPLEIVVSGLEANTQYYYQIIYSDDGETWISREVHSFHTQRPAGSTFKFTIISDSHAMYNAQYQQAVQNVISDNPDFHFDLGDTYMIDGMTSQSAVNTAYMAQRPIQYMGGIGNSAPIFLASGNHENEEGWNFDDSFSLALASVKARKLYYPTPVPDGFYTGNTDPLSALDAGTYGDQYREDYYAWEWGDVLFVVIDPFQYTMTNPYGATAGEGSDDPASGDRWNWTLGEQQFNWFKQTVENSTAKYKFVFAHHMLGGTQNYVRGGAVPAHMFEWGGYNADGTTWGFDTQRPPFGDEPIHQIMINNGVNAFFHGHDHQYAYEVRDGIVYQSMPRPSTGMDFNYYSESDPYTERVLPSSGHLRVTVTPSEATVEYVSSNTTGIAHSYTILPNGPVTTHALTMEVDPTGGGTTNPGVGAHDYAENSVVNISATASTGYTFDHWTGDVANTGSASTTVTMDADKTVTAHFAAVPTYQLTMAVAAGNGTTNPAVGDHTYSQAEVVAISAFPAGGYQFDHWEGDVADVNSSNTTVTMDGNKTVNAVFTEYASGPLSLDGAVSSTTADGVTSVNISHTTGTGMDRLMLVGVSSNSYNGAQTISSVTFTPSGGSAAALSQVGTIENEAGRLAAIFSLLNPPSGVSGTVTVTYSGSVAYGIVVGVANFAGVDQSDPLDDFVSAVGTEAAAINVDVPTDINDLVFDTIFMGAATIPTLTAGASQTSLWNTTVDRAGGAASIEQATSGTTQMSWTASGGATSYYWALGAVPINPVNTTVMPEYNIVLVRPTSSSITVSAIISQNGQASVEYGTESGNYSAGQTGAVAVTVGEPVEILVSGLSSNSQYFYRLRYRHTSGDDWLTGSEHTFHTQRSQGQTFKFTLTSDSHLGATFSNNSSARYAQTTMNIASDDPDFNIDLGDAFLMENADNQAEADAVYDAQRPYFGNYSHSSAVFLAIGNHENEEGWNLDDTPFSQALGSIIARKEYFPNPTPDGFYSGNSDQLSAIGGDQLREDYYAWTWGDALFIVLDPFQYTMTKPYGSITGSGEADDETVDADQWNWTLGEQQYDWFKQTIENSNAKYKFVFAHHIVGGQLNVSGGAGTPGYVRGGAIAVPYFEWGGYNIDDTWGFTTERPGWAEPIHQLMLDNGVSAFFHGHDHQFVHEERDGIVYQLVPAPGMDGYGFDLYDASPYVVDGGNLPNPGHLRITVSPEAATVEYVRSETGGGGINGQVAYSYTIEPSTPPVTHELTMSVAPEGGGTTDPAVGAHTYVEGAEVTITATPASGYVFDHWEGDVADENAAETTVTMDSDQEVIAHFIEESPGMSGDINGDEIANSTDALIILSCDVGIDVSAFCPMDCGDVNADGFINSTDALILLSYDVGITVPFAVGEPGCPIGVTPCAGCNP